MGEEGYRARPTDPNGGIYQMKIQNTRTFTSYSDRHIRLRQNRPLPNGILSQPEIVSSDFCRGLVSDDENDQAATKDAFELLHYIAGKRLDGGRLTVVDATNVQPESRKPLVALARAHDCLPVAIVINTTVRTCQERNKTRSDRDFGRTRHPQSKPAVAPRPAWVGKKKAFATSL